MQFAEDLLGVRAVGDLTALVIGARVGRDPGFSNELSAPSAQNTNHEPRTGHQNVV